MSRVFVAGMGAVSPAGWNVAALRQALAKGEPLPVQSLARPGWDKPLRARLVPNPEVRLEFLAHPRLRRTCKPPFLRKFQFNTSLGLPVIIL